MTLELNNVKTARSRYHHGSLRDALLAAAEKVLNERGPDRFSLRETARRAGVSPAAPAHHFSDVRGLLTGLAAIAFSRFGAALAAADASAGGKRAARIRAQGLAYVEFALANPTLFDLMWRHELIDREDPEYREAARRAFGLLQSAVEGRAPIAVSRPAGDPIDPRTVASWSIVHGYSLLVLGGLYGDDRRAASERARRELPAVLDHLAV